MKSYINTKDFYIKEPCVVAIGKFDGEHLGHRKLLAAMRSEARYSLLKIAVFTFHTPPSQVIDGYNITTNKSSGQITTNDERRIRLSNSGVDYLIEYPFSNETSHISAESFVSDILIKKMNMKAIVTGEDCSFGYKKSGNIELLKSMSKTFDFKVIVIEKEIADQREISSTLIKEELDLGNIEKVNSLLGENYSIEGIVTHGNHIGGPILGFPTANLILPNGKYIPKFGVYVSENTIDDKKYLGISNIGIKPTIEDDSKAGLETFIFNYSGQLYDKYMKTEFLHFIRKEKHFGSMDELKQQIAKDIDIAMQFSKDRKYQK